MIRFFMGKTIRRPAAAVAGAALLTITWSLVVWGQDKPEEPTKPADHAKHAQPDDPAMPPSDPLAEQVRQLRDKVAKLEAALARGAVASDSISMSRNQGMSTGGKSRSKDMKQGGRVASKYQDCLKCHQTRPTGTLPQSHLEKAGEPDGGMIKSVGPSGGGMGKMAGGGGDKPMMDGDNMEMGMMGMGKMAGGKSGGGIGKMAGGGGKPMMGDDNMEMGMMGMGKMAGGDKPMMDDDNMEMGMGAMGKVKGMGGMQRASALPGFPGASHIYHVGTTGFFLDHDEHVTLSANQRKKLNQIKQKSMTVGSSCSRKVEESEQDLWELTASDKPDAAAIETKVREIEKLKGNQRLAFIRSVGEAAKVLTEEQRTALIGTTADAPDEPAPASKP